MRENVPAGKLVLSSALAPRLMLLIPATDFQLWQHWMEPVSQAACQADQPMQPMLINCSDNQCNPITRCNEDSSYINGNRDMGSGQRNATFSSDFILRSLPSNANKKPHALHNSFFAILFPIFSWHGKVCTEEVDMPV